MKRFNAISLELNNDILEALEDLGIECEFALPCTQTGLGTIWTTEFPIELLKLKPVFLDKFSCYYDNGFAELSVKNNDYNEYPIDKIYLVKTGKYEPIIKELI